MRVCLGVQSDNYTIITSASSEPLLAEAAMSAMAHFVPCQTLQGYVQDSLVSTGDRGELIAQVILLGAMDKARKATGSQAYERGRGALLSDFFKALFPAGTASAVNAAKPSRVRSDGEFMELKDRLPRARIWFNHYIKVHSYRVLNRKYLWRLVVRGAAIVCANNQAGIDMVFPYIIDSDLEVGRDNIGLLIVQVKNDGIFSIRPHLSLFDAMDPFELGIYDRDEANPPPVIRMVFALAASSPCVRLVEMAGQSMSQRATNIRASVKIKNAFCAAKKKTTDKPKANRGYTAYDIWCGGASSKTFGYILPEYDPVYANLLRISMRRSLVYSQGAQGRQPTVQTQRRKLNPADEEHSAHWENWIANPDGPSAAEADGATFDSDSD
jgi:hypothetical protein